MLEKLNAALDEHFFALRALCGEWERINRDVPTRILREMLLQANSLWNVTDYAIRKREELDLTDHELRMVQARQLFAQFTMDAVRSVLCVGSRR